MMAESTVTIMKEALNTTQTVKSLGALSFFPREIRDEVYRHCLPKKRYCWDSVLDCASLYDPNDPVVYGTMRYRRLHSKCKEWTKSNLSILSLSKDIKEEAMVWLYLNGTFCLYYNLNLMRAEQVPQHPGTNNMTNFEISYGAAIDPEMGSKSYGWMDGGPLHLFGGDTVTRKSILVVLRLCEWWRYAAIMTVSPLLDALKQLTGFETVTLRLAFVEFGKWPNTDEWRMLYTGFGSVLEDMSMALEPTLGKSSAMSEHLPEEIGPSLHKSRKGIREVVFHPRNHRAAISKAKKDE